MGYKHAKAYKMTFEDFPGLEVYMKGLSVKAFLALARVAGQMKGLDSLAGLKGDDVEAAVAGAEALFGKFADGLQSWNLEDDDGPVPATRAGVESQPLDLILQLAMEWMEAVASVDTPLKKPSPSTPPSGLGLSGAMEPLSASHGS